MKLVKTLVVLALAALATACSKDSPTKEEIAAQQAAAAKVGKPINQADLCEVSNWRVDAVAAVCKPGQKVVFLPESWGNEQLPILFAAVNCDLRYSVALTSGGVTCIYEPMRPKKAK